MGLGMSTYPSKHFILVSKNYKVLEGLEIKIIYLPQ